MCTPRQSDDARWTRGEHSTYKVWNAYPEKADPRSGHKIVCSFDLPVRRLISHESRFHCTTKQSLAVFGCPSAATTSLHQGQLRLRSFFLLRLGSLSLNSLDHARVRLHHSPTSLSPLISSPHGQLKDAHLHTVSRDRAAHGGHQPSDLVHVLFDLFIIPPPRLHVFSGIPYQLVRTKHTPRSRPACALHHRASTCPRPLSHPRSHHHAHHDTRGQPSQPRRARIAVANGPTTPVPRLTFSVSTPVPSTSCPQARSLRTTVLSPTSE